MKKVILALAIVTVTLTSCGSGESCEAPKTDSTAVVVDTTFALPVDTTTCCTTTVVPADTTK